MLVDTHCHVHDDGYELEAEQVIADAREAGVTRMICVGTDLRSSQQAVVFANKYDGVWASAGLHPHDSDNEGTAGIGEVAKDPRCIAIGEIGLDYFYKNSHKDDQLVKLKEQLQIAQDNDLPLIFHVRGSKEDPDDAFNDFWPIFDTFAPLEGVMHSFTGTRKQLELVLERGLHVGLNGIMTFSRDPEHAKMVQAIPAQKLLLETDSPYLTPTPFRGKINQPKYIVSVAQKIAELRGEDLADINRQTTKNAQKLFRIK